MITSDMPGVSDVIILMISAGAAHRIGAQDP